jgi:predicted transcriptional regulator
MPQVPRRSRTAPRAGCDGGASAAPDSTPDCDAESEPAVETADVESATLLDLLDDEYARELLRLIADEARPARELIESSSASKPTVYRRLNRLEEAGLVATRTALDPDGHHHQVYRATIDEVRIALDDGGVSASAVATSLADAAATGRRTGD